MRHHNISVWEETRGNTESSTDTTIPPSVLAPLTVLSSNLVFLSSSSLPPAHLLTSYKRISTHIASFLLTRLAFQRSRGRFSPSGSDGRTLGSILDLLESTCAEALGGRVRPGAISRGWSKIRDASVLLSLDEGEMGRRSVAGMMFDAGEEEFREMMTSLELGEALSWEEVKGVLRARGDVRR